MVYLGKKPNFDFLAQSKLAGNELTAGTSSKATDSFTLGSRNKEASQDSILTCAHSINVFADPDSNTTCAIDCNPHRY
jgi:hypothetical protein